MELMISVKGNKFTVTDKKQQRLLYTIKKKAFSSGRYTLHDASNYQLYTIVQTSDDRKPTFSITHNDVSIMKLDCKSLFLDPTITVSGKDTAGTKINYSIASKDHRDFQLLKDDLNVGRMQVHMTVGGELQYEIEIEDKVFDDYIPLFAIAVDLTFGNMNRNK
ncbi:MAG: hypothetical protein J6U16_09895 [Ruminococcus sp.]|nr:hypothetical protein [Ruminococcus sp.]